MGHLGQDVCKYNSIFLNISFGTMRARTNNGWYMYITTLFIWLYIGSECHVFSCPGCYCRKVETEE